MSSKGHRDTTESLNRPYEENAIQLKGILGFTIGLFLLIVVTFALMWAFLNVLKNYRAEEDRAANPLPNEMLQKDRERLPPEPRLQLAPGFRVEGEKGAINLELAPPQAEWRALQKEWAQIVEHGIKDERSGAVVMMPVEEAMNKLLTQNVKARTGPEAEEFYEHSKLYVSDANSGRAPFMQRR